MAGSRGSRAVDISGLGDKRLQAKLKALDTKVQKSIVRRALRAGARVVLSAAKALAPVETGALREGIKLLASKARRGFFGVQIRTPTRAELGIPADATGYYPAVLEYGAEGHPAHPYLRPALDQAREAAKDTIAQAIRDGIEETVK